MLRLRGFNTDRLHACNAPPTQPPTTQLAHDHIGRIPQAPDRPGISATSTSFSMPLESRYARMHACHEGLIRILYVFAGSMTTFARLQKLQWETEIELICFCGAETSKPKHDPDVTTHANVTRNPVPNLDVPRIAPNLTDTYRVPCWAFGLIDLNFD
jgi:hypothetical protein